MHKLIVWFQKHMRMYPGDVATFDDIDRYLEAKDVSYTLRNVCISVLQTIATNNGESLVGLKTIKQISDWKWDLDENVYVDIFEENPTDIKDYLYIIEGIHGDDYDFDEFTGSIPDFDVRAKKVYLVVTHIVHDAVRKVCNANRH